MYCGGGDDLAGAAEHSALRRLRHRRALAFLWLQRLDRTYDSMCRETYAAFSVVYLRDLVTDGQWHEAISYLSRFLPLHNDECLSVHANVLHRFLVIHMDLANILAGTKQGNELAAYFCKYQNHDRTVCRGSLRMRCLLLTALHATQQFRASLNWELVREEAAYIVDDLAHRIPELKGMARLPHGPLKPHNILPIRSCTGRRCHRNKPRCRPQAYVLAEHYIQKRRRLHFSSRSKESPAENRKKMKWVVDIVDDSLKAGKLPTIGKQGASSAPIWQTMFGTLSGAAQNPGMSSVASSDKSLIAADFLKVRQGHSLQTTRKQDPAN